MQHLPDGEVCPHAFDDASFRIPRHTDTVCRSECAYCCATDKHPGGVFVCARCFVGVCPDHIEKHLALEPTHITFVRIETTTQYPDKEPVITDINQVGALPPTETKVRVYCGDCGVNFALQPDFDFAASHAATAIVNANAPTAAAADGVGADAAALGYDAPCKHCNSSLPQEANATFGSAADGKRAPTEKEQCASCDHAKNNWMCLTCGAVGCPRKEAGGKEHGIFHYMMTMHPLVVKLGTITPTGADVHCYGCGSEVRNYPELAAHLKHFGIEMHASVKTAKSLAEMQLDASMKHEYDAIQEEGSKLVPVYGPGLTGLVNFGNTCYIASIVQTLMATPPFVQRFGSGSHMKECKRAQPLNCLECQVERLVTGMLSGNFSIAPPASAASNDDASNSSSGGESYRDKMLREDRNGIEPKLFKQLVAGSNPEFKGKNQQDAEEYLTWLMETMRAQIPKQQQQQQQASSDNAATTQQLVHPGQLFQYLEETRRSCSKCQSVRYTYNAPDTLKLLLPIDPPPPVDPAAKMTDEEREARRATVTFEQMGAAYLEPSVCEAVCPHCKERSNLVDERRLATFPDFVAIKACREFYCRVTNTVRKHDAKVIMPHEEELLNLSRFASSGGFKEGEETWMTQEVGGSSSSAPQQQQQQQQVAAGGGGGGASSDFVQPNEEMVAMLVGMDFPEAKVRWALHKTKNDADGAIGYIFDHPDEPSGADMESLNTGGGGGASSESQSQQQQEAPARQASQDGAAATVDSPVFPDKARVGADGPGDRYELYALVSHMGQNATSGHWIAHIKHPEHGWVIFNDQKVAKSQQPPFDRATIYVYRRRK